LRLRVGQCVAKPRERVRGAIDGRVHHGAARETQALRERETHPALIYVLGSGSATGFGYHAFPMLTAPRISGSWLRSLARLARTRAGSSALEIALRAELGINALGDLPSSLFGAFPLDNRARSGRPPRKLEDLALGVPKSGWSKSSADFVAAYESRRATPERILSRVLEGAGELARMTPSMRVLLDVAEDDAKNDAESSGDRYRVGAPKGPLDGVCIVIKEQTHVRGLPAKGGTAYMDGAPQ